MKNWKPASQQAREWLKWQKETIDDVFNLIRQPLECLSSNEKYNIKQPLISDGFLKSSALPNAFYRSDLELRGWLPEAEKISRIEVNLQPYMSYSSVQISEIGAGRFSITLLGVRLRPRYVMFFDWWTFSDVEEEKLGISLKLCTLKACHDTIKRKLKVYTTMSSIN